MRTIYIGNGENIENTDKYALCIGMFDGIHLGHRALINLAVQRAEELKVKSGAVTFLSPETKNKIYLFGQQAELFSECGIDTLFVVLFDREFKLNGPETFIKEYLLSRMNAVHLICGRNFTFGKDKSGNAQTFSQFSEKYGYTYDIVPDVCNNGYTISSSLIRQLLENGDIVKANELLGNEFYLEGCVQKGLRLGRTLGYPTINIAVSERICIIKKGVYESSTVFDGKVHKSITNIGTAPTPGKDKGLICETYLLDYNANLYNKYVKIYLSNFIREEKKFGSINELKKEISENISALCNR